MKRLVRCTGVEPGWKAGWSGVGVKVVSTALKTVLHWKSDPPTASGRHKSHPAEKTIGNVTTVLDLLQSVTYMYIYTYILIRIVR